MQQHRLIVPNYHFVFAAISSTELYSSSSVIRCSMDKGSLKLTGIGIFDKSFPTQFLIIFHKLILEFERSI